MPSAIETTVDTYIRLVTERDLAKRAAMLEACFAEDGRLVPRGNELRGRAAISASVDRFLADPLFERLRVNAVNAKGKTFWLSVTVERSDGSTADVFDAGEVDETGRISLILTFNGRPG